MLVSDRYFVHWPVRVMFSAAEYVIHHVMLLSSVA